MAGQKKSTNHSAHTSNTHKSGQYSKRGYDKRKIAPNILDGTEKELRVPGWLKTWRKSV